MTKSKKSPARLVITAVVIVLGLTGLVLIGNGIWVKAKAEIAQILLERAFEHSKQGSINNASEYKPWHWADISPIARLSAPRLGRQEIVLNNVSGEALSFGPGHLENTPLPGELGTSVFAAHRDTHFVWLQDLQIGDILEVERNNGETLSFRITRNWIAEFDQSGIDADSAGKKLVLSTCYPFNSSEPGPLRFMVEAELMVPDGLITASLK